MRKSLYILCALFALAVINANADELDKTVQQKTVSTVKDYCKLMTAVSGNVENIDKQDALFALCENSNVSVFNDLVPPSKDMSVNSMPLQQYMMLVTDRFENNVKTDFSGFKYVKTIVQPSPLPDFPAARYAFVKVDKKTTAKGLKSENHFNILVNVGTMKVSSTISEDYEDPQRIYLEGLEKFNDKDYKGAAKSFEKISNLQRYPGRYRAKAMLGWSLVEMKQFQKAYDVLSESSDAGDPLGSIILASKILMSDRVPANMKNTTRGYNLLVQNGNKRDKEMPTMHLIAKTAIIDGCLDFLTLKPKLTVSGKDLMELADDILSDSATNDAFNLRAYIAKSMVQNNPKDEDELQEALENITKAECALNSSKDISDEENHRLDIAVLSLKSSILENMGEHEKAQASFRELMKKPYAASTVATTFLQAGDNKTALEYFKKAADNNDPLGTYMMSLDAFPWTSDIIDKMQYHNYIVVWYNTISQSNSILGNGTQKKWLNFIWYLVNDSTSTRTLENYKIWNQKAMDLGSVDAIEDRAIHEVCGFGYEKDVNIPYGLELACKAANMGFFSTPNKLGMVLAFSYYPPRDGDNYIESQCFKTLKKLADEGNPAAEFMLSEEYDMILKDTVSARKYLEESAAANFFLAMQAKTGVLINEGKYDEAYKMAQIMTAFPKSGAYSILGQIDMKFRHDYKSARANFIQGMKNEWDYECPEGLSDLYRDGLGVKKSLKRASDYMETTITLWKGANPMSDINESDEGKRLLKKKAEIDSLLALEQNAPSEVSAVGKLNDVLDASISDDDRITLSQQLLTELFASPKAVVRTIGSNGTTVVATETAEDFMLSLATMQTGKKISEVSSKKDKDGKFTELSVKIEQAD